MAIEVRELVIKAAVMQDGATGTASGHASGDNNAVSSAEENINTSIEKMLEILKEKKER